MKERSNKACLCLNVGVNVLKKINNKTVRSKYDGQKKS